MTDEPASPIAGPTDANGFGPLKPVAGAPGSQPAPAASPIPTAAPTKAAPAQTAPAQPAATSEPPQAQQAPPRPVVDPRPYAWLAENKPQLRDMIDQAANQVGISPTRLAAHMHVESGFNMYDKHGGVLTGTSGERGWMQIMPSTAKGIDPTLNVDDPVDNLRLGAQYIREGDDKFGRDTRSSIAFYNGGPGTVEDLAAHPDQAYQRHPNTMHYVDRMTPGFEGQGGFVGPSQMTPRGLVLAGSNGGPSGMLNYISQAMPQGMTMSDGWQHAEGMLTKAFLERGDIAGAQHARDYILQMSHAGSNQYLMAAHQSLTAGDGVSAAQALAKAHAFFPDGTAGQFGVDGKGQVWGQRMDEHTGKPMAGPFQVTPENVAGMLNQTADPKQYLSMVLEQQKTAAAIRHQDAMGDYYSGLLHSRENIAAGHDTARVDAAEVRAQSRQGVGPAAALSKQADKETETTYGPDMIPEAGGTVPPVETRAKMAEIHHDVRMNGGTPILAEQVARGVATNKLAVQRQSDGSYGVVDPKNPQGAPITYLSPALVQRMTGGKMPGGQQGAVPGRPGQGAPAASPIGASANSPYAMGAGVRSDLTGTTQSSAIPTQPGQ